MSCFETLDVDVIKANLQPKVVGRDVVVYKSSLSSSDIAWHCADSDKSNGLAVFVEHQTAGRGRRGNIWLSEKGHSILCSIVLTDCPCKAELLTLTSAVAAAEAIGRCGGKQAMIKWPNDILIGGKKAAGILLESQIKTGKTNYVIGIGINCHQGREFFAGVDMQWPATSIDIENGAVTDRNSLAKRLLVSMDSWLDIAKRDQKKVIRQWQKLSSLLGHRVSVICDQQQFSGNCIGVDPAEGLILQLDGGAIRIFDAAHTMIVK